MMKRFFLGEATMRLLVLLILLVSCAAAGARTIKMTIGKDAFAFDFNYNGRVINVYDGEVGDVYTDELEGLMHDWFMLEDMIDGNRDLASNFAMGRSEGIKNAFAIIFNQKRYIVIDAAWVHEYRARFAVLGHELGHHVCGHTIGMMRSDPWAKELEADRFAGWILKNLERRGYLEFDEAVAQAAPYFGGSGSASHSPGDQRRQAIEEGYRNGSDCVERKLMQASVTGSLPSGSAVTGSAVASFWNHNGSIVALKMDGAGRKLYYDTPRAEIQAAGVERGTLLFEGRRTKDRSGTAYVFSRSCGPQPYSVHGVVSSDLRTITVQGKAPRLDANCQVIGYNDDVLVFNRQ
jgi:hypothetical protein